MPIDCLHPEFDTKCKITHLANVDRYILEVAIRCAECRRVFIFQGLYPENLALSPVEDMLLLNKASGAGPDFIDAEEIP